jgi:hypothetical protein
MTTEKKRTIIYSIVFSTLALLLIGFGFLISHLNAKGNHDQTRFGIYKIRLSGWGELYQAWAKETLPSLNRLGPTFQIVDSGEDITVYNVSRVTSVTQCISLHGIAFEHNASTGASRIIIDPVCTRGENEFKTAFMHEVGHSLGMTHVCRLQDSQSGCSSVGRGAAVMNPSIVYDTQVQDELEEQLGATPTWEIQELDIREFCRIRNCKY